MKRKRASTRAILGDIFQDIVTEPLSPPEPLKDLGGYTDERLKKGLAFADGTLRNKKRQISPIATHLLTLYKNTVKDALDKANDDEDRDALVKTVAVFERDINNQRFLRGPPGSDMSSYLVQRLAELRRYEFAARYGDYMQHVCESLKCNAQAEKTQYFEQLQGWNRYWTDIANDIRSEGEAWEQWQLRTPGVQDEHVKTTLAVRFATSHMGLNFDHIISTIQMYAQRNELVHASIFHFVGKGQWNTLAKLLYRDLMELPTVIPHTLRHNIPVLQCCIQKLIDQYFTYDEDEPYEYEAWSPRPEAREKVKQMRAHEEQRAEALIKERKRLEESAVKKFNKEVGDHSMVHLTAAVAGLPPPSGMIEAAKRSSSAAENEERMDIFKRQKKAWNELVSIQKNACKRAHQYRDLYGNVEAPVDPKYWLSVPEDENSRPGTSGSKEV